MPNLVLAAISLTAPYAIQGIQVNPFGIVVLRIIAGLGYFLIGFLLAQWVKKGKQVILLISSSGLMICGIMAYLKIGSGYSFFDGTFLNMTGSLICSLSSGCGVICTAAWLERISFKGTGEKVLNIYGKNSLIVMLVHPTLLLCFTYPFGRLMANCSGMKGVVISLTLWGIIVVLEIPFVWIINEKFPWLIGKLPISKYK